MSASVVAGPFHGTLDFNDDGSFNYTPDCRFYRRGSIFVCGAGRNECFGADAGDDQCGRREFAAGGRGGPLSRDARAAFDRQCGRGRAGQRQRPEWRHAYDASFRLAGQWNSPAERRWQLYLYARRRLCGNRYVPIYRQRWAVANDANDGDIERPAGGRPDQFRAASGARPLPDAVRHAAECQFGRRRAGQRQRRRGAAADGNGGHGTPPRHA